MMSGARNSKRAPRTIFVDPSATTRHRTHLLLSTEARANRQGASSSDVLASNSAARGPAPSDQGRPRRGEGSDDRGRSWGGGGRHGAGCRFYGFSVCCACWMYGCVYLHMCVYVSMYLCMYLSICTAT